MKIYIYQIYFPTSNKCYIGQTNNIQKRMFEHLGNKSLVGNALRKYDDWTIEILHTVKDRDVANLLEIEEIRHYNCVAPNGYNLTRGGEGNSASRSEEWKQNQSKRMQGNSYGKGGKSTQGYKHTKETIEKIKNKMQGKKHPAVGKANRQRKGNKNPNAHSVQSEIKRLKTRIAKLETND